MADKIPPHNIDAEKSVLGAFLIDKDSLVRVANFLKAEHFYEQRHQVLYQAIVDLFMAGVPIDLLTIVDFLKRKESLKSVGGRSYIAELINSVPTSAHAEEYAKIVKETALRRKMITAAAHIADLAFTSDIQTSEALNLAQQDIFNVSVQGIDKGFIHIRDLLEQTMEEAAHVSDSGITGISTGFRDLDALLGGMQKSDLVIIAARPSMGKTSFALDILRSMAIEGKKVAFFSLEMSNSQVTQRLLSMQSSVGIWETKTGKLNDDEWGRLSEGIGILSDLSIFIDDSPGANIIELRTKARRLFLEQGVDAIFIDYLQLIQGNSREGRVQEVSQISQELKNMARELKVPVIALSQLSRKVEDRDGRQPQLSDLRDSGSIEQDADVVMFIHREEYYDPETEKKGIADIRIAKHRNGPVGNVEVAFVKELASFRNLHRD